MARLLDVLSFGPMDPEHLRGWVNDGMEGGGVRHRDIARWILALAGNRTRDVAQLARTAFQLVREEGRADADTVRQAFPEIIADETSVILGILGHDVSLATAKHELFQDFARIGKATSSPARLELLDLLAQGEKTVETLARQAGLSGGLLPRALLRLSVKAVEIFRARGIRARRLQEGLPDWRGRGLQVAVGPGG